MALVVAQFDKLTYKYYTANGQNFYIKIHIESANRHHGLRAPFADFRNPSATPTETQEQRVRRPCAVDSHNI